jgi:haloalkane dehalogenase
VLAEAKALHQRRSSALLTGRSRDLCRRWPHQREVNIRGVHYVKEDSPAEIGAVLGVFLALFGPADASD